MIFKEDKGTGYMYCYAPSHPTANAAGKVMEHVYVMTEHIGRLLDKDECVHHVDRDKKNNLISNLMLLTISEHTILHAIEDKGYKVCESICPVCKIAFSHTNKLLQTFCSETCSKLGSRKFEISADELRALVWKYPTTDVAKQFGVSDTAVSKRCKLLGVIKPPRGYWAKVKAGKTASK